MERIERMELIERVRTFEIDHTPDGWPAIQMRDISTLANELEKSERKLAVAREAIYVLKRHVPVDSALHDQAEEALTQIGGDDAGA